MIDSTTLRKLKRILGRHSTGMLEFVALLTAIFSALTTYLSWQATSRQTEVAEQALRFARHEYSLKYFQSLPRIVPTPVSEPTETEPVACIRLKNIGTSPSVGYEIFLLNASDVASALISTTHPLSAEQELVICDIAIPKEKFTLLVVNSLAGIVQQGVLPLTNNRNPKGGQYKCEFFSFTATQSSGSKRMNYAPSLQDTQLTAEYWNKPLPTKIQRDVICSGEYAIY